MERMDLTQESDTSLVTRPVGVATGDSERTKGKLRRMEQDQVIVNDVDAKPREMESYLGDRMMSEVPASSFSGKSNGVDVSLGPVLAQEGEHCSTEPSAVGDSLKNLQLSSDEAGSGEPSTLHARSESGVSVDPEEGGSEGCETLGENEEKKGRAGKRGGGGERERREDIALQCAMMESTLRGPYYASTMAYLCREKKARRSRSAIPRFE
jgi:hypothetical protein